MAHQTVYRSGGKISRAVATKTKAQHFLDNDEFKLWIKEYQEACALAREEGREIPNIPNKLGDAFYKISLALSKKPNFIGYSWIDDMVDAGVVKMCEVVHKFNVEAGTSAFAYFQQCAYYEFLDYLNNEAYEKTVKAAIVQNIGSMLEDVATQEVDADADFKSSMGEILALQSVEIDYKIRKKKEPSIDYLPWDLFDVEENGMDKIEVSVE